MEAIYINNLKFLSGDKPGDPPLDFQIPNGTSVVLVGPNNSGKSLALREIQQYCQGVDLGAGAKKLQNVGISFPNDIDALENFVREFETEVSKKNKKDQDQFSLGYHGVVEDDQGINQNVNKNSLKQAIEQNNDLQIKKLLGKFYSLRLDGMNRFQLIQSKPQGNLHDFPKNHLAALFIDDESRAEVSKLTYDVFGLYYTLDPSNQGTLHPKLNPQKPNPGIERALTKEALDYHKDGSNMSDFSTGVQSFVATVSAVLSGKHKVILVDEPDAFLHPPLARRLGNELSKLASKRDGSLVIATHSSEFVAGCLESAKQSTIVRLTYDQKSKKSTARVLPASSLKDMVNDPILKTNGVLRALFHNSVVVTEADTDRAFYDEINQRLLAEGRGIKDNLFLNAHNWQTISRIVGPLRAIGIPVAGIMDLDVILGEGSDWTKIFKAFNVEESDIAILREKRSSLKQIIQQNAKDSREGKKAKQEADNVQIFNKNIKNIVKNLVKKKGINAFKKKEDRDSVREFIAKLSAYGLFLVPKGEVESWLSTLRINGHAAHWLVELFSKIGKYPENDNYLKPGRGDVWNFIDSIKQWILKF